MKNLVGCLGIFLIIGLIIAIVSWVFHNIVGVLGIAAVLLGIFSWNKNKKIGSITTIIGLLIAIGWFSFSGHSSSNTASKPTKESVTTASKSDTIKSTSTEDESKTDNSSTTTKENNTQQTTTPTQSSNSTDAVNSTTSSSGNSTPNDLVPVTLVETVDGDTIKVNYKGKVETVRYLLVDTPEDNKPGTCVQPFALDAANRNKQLVNSGQLSLEFEQGKSKTDKYGRLLAYVFVNGQSVEETLLKEGYARVAYVYEPPYKYLSQYQSDESTAKSQSLNIWSKPGYATDSGFVGCVNSTATSTTPKQSTPSTNTQSAPSAPSTSTNTGAGATQIFANCTELKKVYPQGVPSSSPAYQSKMDRDNDGFACETN